MKKILASALTLAVLVGATGAAEAKWFWQNEKAEIKAEAREMKTDATEYHQTNKARNTENKKMVYSGNNSYRSVAGQVAVQDRIGDKDDTAFVVHPVHGRVNSSLLQGDTGQSSATRLNHSFNN